MKKKWIALALAMTMCAGMLSACGGTAPTAESSASEATAAATTAEAAASEEPSAGESAAEPSETEPAATISYPLAGGTTFVAWKTMNGQFAQMISSYKDNHCLDYINEQTGVTLDFIEPSDTVADTQFNLMIASGDYPDFLDCTQYTGGLAAAYNQGVICDLTDDIPVDAPDYQTAIEGSNEATIKSLKDDEGRMYCVYTINNTYFVERGLVIRNDWVKDVGKEIPTTTDELFDTLTAIHDKYQTPYTFNIDPDGVMQYVIGAFGISGFSLDGSSIGCYVDTDGKTVKSSLQQDGYRDYLEYFKKYYDTGLIDSDFYNAQMQPGNMKAVTNQTALWFGMADSFSSDLADADDPNYDAVGIGAIVQKAGDSYNFGDLPTMTGRANYSISTTCSDVHLALNYINWFYTDEGYQVCNYGLEGESFTKGDDGQPVYTDLITNNPNGWNKVNSKVVYCFWNIMPFYNAQDALLYTYTGREVESMDTWTAVGYSQTLPTLSYLTTETDEYTSLVTDIATYATEICLKFITGGEELNDANWDEFQSTLTSMNIDRAVEITQAAYDRYLQR